MELSRRALRQIETLSPRYRFDIEKRVATIPLHYETPTDLLDEHLSCPGNPIVSDDAIDYFCDLMSDIPKAFTVEFSLTIDDYGEYDHTSLMHAVQATIENTFYYHDENRKKSNILSVGFLFIGVIILSIETIGGMTGWFGSESSFSRIILETLLEVMVWVFLWEGAALLFLVYDNESTHFSRNMHRFFGLQLLNNTGELLSSLDQQQFYHGWIYLSRKEIFARNFILFSNFALLALFAIDALSFLNIIGSISGTQLLVFMMKGILTLLLVVSNIAFYRESGKLRHYAPALSVIALCVCIFDLVFPIIQGIINPENIVWDAVLIIDLVINYICLCYMRKMNVEVKGRGTTV